MSTNPLKPTIVAPRSQPPLAAIRPGRSERGDEAIFGTLLVWFMRLLALLWMVQGLSTWALMLLGGENGPGLLAQTTDLGTTALIFFAVLDLVAAVGLWLTASWGGVVWLVAVAAQWLALVVLPGFVPYDLWIAGVDVLLVAGYFVLIYKAAQEIDA